MPEILDLTRHRPEEFEGKTVTLRGRDYVIGPRFRQSDQGWAHLLTNALSLLTLHAIQIRPSYLTDPQQARQASEAKEQLTADLRRKMAASGQEVQVSLLTCHEGHGGTFELHEAPGMFGPLAGQDVLEQADARSQAGDHAGAIVQLRRLLQEHPGHTVALDQLAWSCLQATRYEDAQAAIARALEVEPNLALYRGHQVLIGFSLPRARSGIDRYEELRAWCPLVHDYDGKVVEGLLHCGEPQRARQVLQAFGTEGAEVERLRREVDAALEGHERAQVLLEPVRKALRKPATARSATPWAQAAIDWMRKAMHGVSAADARDGLERLTRAHDADPRDPILAANLAFALREHGRHREAADLLLSAASTIPDAWVPYCWSNAALCLLELDEWRPAIRLLTTTMLALSEGGAREVRPLDVPGVARWIEGSSVTESNAPSAAELLDAAIARCPDPDFVTPEVQRLAALYRQAHRIALGGTGPAT